MRLLAGNSYPTLAQNIRHELQKITRNQEHFSSAQIEQFSNGEISVKIQGEDFSKLQDHEFFIIQTFSDHNAKKLSINDLLMETYLMIDTLRRAGCRNITGVFPFLPYSRQDKNEPDIYCPISASLIAQQLQNAGLTRLITVDLHTPQITGFYQIPVDNLSANSLLAQFIRNQYFTEVSDSDTDSEADKESGWAQGACHSGTPISLSMATWRGENRDVELMPGLQGLAA